MAYIISSKNIIDIQSKGVSKIGISIPFNKNNIFTPTYNTKDQLKYNLINLILTQKGEKIFEPGFGTNIKRLLFEQEIDDEIVYNEVSNIINKYLPDISLDKIKITNNEHTVNMNIYYIINITQERENISINI